METKKEIRELKRSDLGEIYSLGKKEFYGEEWFSKKFLEDTFKRKTVSYVFENGGKIKGIIMVDILDKPKAWIFFFIVEKNLRRKGIGTLLLKEVEKKLPKKNYLLLVDFEKTDHSARKFYKKNGFREQAKIKAWFGIRHYGLIYEKIIK